MMLDRRLHAFRPDLAEAALEGKVEATRFVTGAGARVSATVVGLRPQPDLARGIDTELLRGEEVTIFDRKDGWCWVKARSDGYVGYLPEAAVRESQLEPTHIVVPQRTPALWRAGAAQARGRRLVDGQPRARRRYRGSAREPLRRPR